MEGGMIFAATAREQQVRKVEHVCERLPAHGAKERVVTVLLTWDCAQRLTGGCSRCGRGWEGRT